MYSHAYILVYRLFIVRALDSLDSTDLRYMLYSIKLYVYYILYYIVFVCRLYLYKYHQWMPIDVSYLHSFAHFIFHSHCLCSLFSVVTRRMVCVRVCCCTLSVPLYVWLHTNWRNEKWSATETTECALVVNILLHRLTIAFITIKIFLFQI